MISFDPFFRTLEEKGIKKSELRGVVHPSTIAKMGRNEMVTLDTIIKICLALCIPIEDVIEVIHT